MTRSRNPGVGELTRCYVSSYCFDDQICCFVCPRACSYMPDGKKNVMLIHLVWWGRSKVLALNDSERLLVRQKVCPFLRVLRYQTERVCSVVCLYVQILAWDIFSRNKPWNPLRSFKVACLIQCLWLGLSSSTRARAITSANLGIPSRWRSIRLRYSFSSRLAVTRRFSSPTTLRRLIQRVGQRRFSVRQVCECWLMWHRQGTVACDCVH